VVTGQNRKHNIFGNLAAIGNTTAIGQGVLEWVVEQPFVLDAAVLVGHKVFSGTGFLELTASRKRGAGAFVNLFITNPKIDMAEGDYERSDSGNGGSVDAQIDTLYEEIEAGDIIRIDLVTVPAVADLTLGMRGCNLNFLVTPGS